jgi:hypothetical protein
VIVEDTRRPKGGGRHLRTAGSNDHTENRTNKFSFMSAGFFDSIQKFNGRQTGAPVLYVGGGGIVGHWSGGGGAAAWRSKIQPVGRLTFSDSGGLVGDVRRGNLCRGPAVRFY